MPPVSTPARFRERRSTPRRTRALRVLFMADDSVLNEPFSATLLDASVGGLRLAIRREEIDAGTQLLVRPPQAPPGAPWIPVLVRHCRRRDAEHWELGCQFLHALTPRTLQLFAS